MVFAEWRTLNHLAWKSDISAWGTLLFVLCAMLAACAGFTAVLKINQTAQASYQSANQVLLSGVLYKVHSHNDAEPLTKTDYVALRQQGITNLVPMLRSYQQLHNTSDNRTRRVELVGLDIFALPASQFTQLSVNETQAANASLPPFWQAPYRTLAHNKLQTSLDGGNWQLQNGQPLPSIEFVAIEQLGNELILDIGVMQALLQQDHLSELLVLGKLSETDYLALKQALPAHLSITSFVSGDDAEQLTDSFHLNLMAMGILMFVVCMFVVMNALHLLLQKRINQFRICRQLGLSRQHILLNLFCRWLVLSIIMALLGALLGSFLAEQLTPSVNQTLRGLYGVNITHTQAHYWQYATICIAANIIGTTCALLLPLTQLNQQLAKIRNSRGLVFRQPQHLWLFAALTFASSAAVLAKLSQGLITSFTVVALLLFSGCSVLIYLLPLALKWLFNLVPRHFAMLSWSLADSVGLSRSSKIACCAFFIAVATNVGMNLMVDSFRQATEQWLKQRLVGDYYLYSETPETFIEALAQSNLDVRAAPRLTQAASMNGVKVQLNSYQSDILYQQSLRFADAQREPWSGFINNKYVFISQQSANAFGLSIGDVINLSTFDKASNSQQLISREVAAIYYDYGNTQRQMLLPTHFFGHTSETRLYALHVKPTQNEAFKLWYPEQAQRSRTNIIATDELMKTSLQTFDRTFLITGSLNMITLTVAAISLVTSFLLINLHSTPAHSLLRSLGVSHLQLGVWVVFQYTLIVVFSCLFAIPFGIALSWLLINYINVQAFGWSYPLLLDSVNILRLTGTSVILLIVTLLVPIYLRSKRSLLKDLKWLS